MQVPNSSVIVRFNLHAAAHDKTIRTADSNRVALCCVTGAAAAFWEMVAVGEAAVSIWFPLPKPDDRLRWRNTAAKFLLPRRGRYIASG